MWDTLGAEGAGWCHCEEIFDYLWKVMVIRRGYWGLEEKDYHSHLQKGQEEGSVKLQVCQEVMEQFPLDSISKKQKGQDLTGISLKHNNTFFYCEGGQTLELLVQGIYAVSIFADSQNTTGHSAE